MIFSVLSIVERYFSSASRVFLPSTRRFWPLRDTARWALHRRLRQQVSRSHQVVSRRGEREHPLHPRLPAMSQLPQQTYGLHPAKNLFYSFAHPLADLITCVPRGASIDGTATSPLLVPRHVRRHLLLSQGLYQVLLVVSFVSAQRHALLSTHFFRHLQLEMAEEVSGEQRVTLGGDKGYDQKNLVEALRKKKVTPHVARNEKRRGGSAIDGRTARHAGYEVSQRMRKRVEEIFGWMKTIGLLRKLRHRGEARVEWMFTFTAAAYNLVRARNLLAQAAV